MDRVMQILNQIEYGFKDSKNHNLFNTDKWNYFNDFYYLQTPDELLITKCGICWDQVELERKIFINDNVKTYFIYIQNNNHLPSHTFLVIKKDKYIWFEHAWEKYKGIHEYNSLDELLDDVINKFITDNYIHNTILYLYEYERPPRHIKCMQFYNYITTQKLIRKKEL